jgi:glycosyltransferase involved in cell wall biosynthesis
LSGSPPAVTVLMPVRDCATTLGLTLRSLARQTLADWRLLVLDDGSRDGTAELARRLGDSRVEVLADGRTLGLAARLNQAIELARSPYLARMDGDDVCYPERLERQLAFMEAHRELDLVGAAVMVFGPGGRPLGTRSAPPGHDAICARPGSGFPLVHPTFFGRADFFRRHRYRPSLLRSQDQDLLLRSYRESRFANVPEILLGYREERLTVRKQAAGRRHLAAAAWRELRRQGRPVSAARAVAGQVAKLGVDTFAIRTGLSHRLLRHRARPVPAEELRRWRELWESLAAEGAAAAP